jgi:molecular chaperone DnaK
VPVEKKNIFSTASDNQTAVTVRVFQGERKMAASNRLLGEFNLEGIPPQPRGIPQIEVKFDIDQNGILSVSARELGTGKEAKVQIKEASGLDSSEIEQMRKDAEANADEDRKQFELAESRNKASQIIYQCEKLMKENEDKLTASDREPMNKAIEKLKTASAGNDASTIRQATDELNAASQAFSKIIYDRSTDSSSIKENQKSTNAKDDDAIDAEFEIKD